MAANMESDPFVYSPLERCGSIRLIKARINDAGILDCAMLQTALDADELPNYSALSYVWGNSSITESIICNGRSMVITATLGAALKHVTQHNPHEYLWADQICINQLDADERSQQVKLMGAIFQVSRSVLAYLGPEKENTGLAVDLINRISAIAERMEYAEDDDSEKLAFKRDITADESEQLGVSFSDTAQWDALCEFFDNPWFERAWVVQELLPAQVQEASDKIEGKIVAGLHVLWWDEVKLTASWIVYKGDNRPQPEKVNIDGVLLTTSMRLSWKSRQSKYYGKGPSRGKFNFRALSLLENFRNRISTDPRDKVYAFIGISDLVEASFDFEVVPNVEVDYGKSVMEVYRDTAIAIIKDIKGLDILISATPRSEEEGWPSWVPDWRIRDCRDAGERLSRNKPVDISWKPDIPVQLLESPDKNSLHVVGKILGRATLVHTERHSKDVIWENDVRILRDRVVNMLESYSTGEDVATAFTLTLSAGKLPRSVEEAGTTEQQFADSVLDFMAAVKLPKDTEEEREYRYDEMARFRHLGLDADWLRPYLILCERRFFVTDTGYMGLGNHYMVEGDVIAILFGMHAPCALRPRSDDPRDGYEFIGEAYVRGAMDGEATKDLPRSGDGLVVGDEILLR